jgi:hypothetical protein
LVRWWNFLPPRNITAAVLDAVAGAIFLFLGAKNAVKPPE